MVTGRQKHIGTGSPGEEKKIEHRHAGTGHDDACRCKEVSVMPPRKLFGLMLSDLAFWKKTGKK